MSAAPFPALLVVCLCADWCGTCKTYQPLFAALAARFPQVQLRWVDVEDEAEMVDPVEVENFPTLLIANAQQTLFFGTVLPHAQTLERLVESCLDGHLPPQSVGPEIDQLRLRLTVEISNENAA